MSGGYLWSCFQLRSSADNWVESNAPPLSTHHTRIHRFTQLGTTGIIILNLSQAQSIHPNPLPLWTPPSPVTRGSSPPLAQGHREIPTTNTALHLITLRILLQPHHNCHLPQVNTTLTSPHVSDLVSTPYNHPHNPVIFRPLFPPPRSHTQPTTWGSLTHHLRALQFLPLIYLSLFTKEVILWTPLCSQGLLVRMDTSMECRWQMGIPALHLAHRRSSEWHFLGLHYMRARMLIEKNSLGSLYKVYVTLDTREFNLWCKCLHSLILRTGSLPMFSKPSRDIGLNQVLCRPFEKL